MGPLTGTSEIIETSKDLNDVHSSKRLNPLSSNSRVAEIVGKHLLPILARDCSAENNLNQLVEAIDLRNSSRGAGPSNQPGAISIRKNTMKKPIRVGISQASGIGVSEPVSLKQALRGLCISQASEMATQKRLSKPAGLSGVSEAGTIKRLYRTVVVQAGESGHPLEEGNGGGISILPNSGTSSTCGLSNPVNGNFVEISLVPESGTSDSSEQISESLQSAKVDLLKQNAISPWPRAVRTTPKTVKTKNLFQDELVSVSREAGSKSPKPSPRMKVNSDSAPSTPGFISRSPRTSCKGIISDAGSRANRMVCKNKNCARRKGKQVSPSVSSSSSMRGDVGSGDLGRSTNKLSCSTASLTPKNISKESQSPASRSCNVEASSSYTNTDKTKSNCSLNTCDQDRTIVKTCESSRSREKGECSQSSKSSIGEYSSSSAISDESNLSGSSCNGNRPHMSMDSRWEAIRQVEMQHGSLGLRHFKFLKRLGCGDIGTVYLAELTGSKCQFALKVMDNEFLASRKKMLRAQTEKDILQMLDHPFLPTLYTHFTTDRLSCLVMEYCPGGDLHVLRQRQPGKSFSEQAARFYAAEILLALEYLHMLGVVYRDLKPENVLVREDGHIMLSDFDLSLRCTVNPTLLKSSSSGNENERKVSGICAESSCINPPCIQPWVQMPCFTPRHISPKTRKLKPDIATQVSPLPQLVVEPIDARSNSFVGTHEYLAPEIIKGEGHGSAVDWWTFGIFLYELLFGKTPFKGSENQDTLANVVSQCLKFPENPAVGYAARDLIKGLLIKEPGNRVGLLRGAAEIKQHPFFEGLNWALVRCASPPEMPKVTGEVAVPATTYRKTEGKCLEFRSAAEKVEFELF